MGRLTVACCSVVVRSFDVGIVVVAVGYVVEDRILVCLAHSSYSGGCTVECDVVVPGGIGDYLPSSVVSLPAA